jgi:hypothetical protein
MLGVAGDNPWQNAVVLKVVIAIQQPSASMATVDYWPLCFIVGGFTSPARGE